MRKLFDSRVIAATLLLFGLSIPAFAEKLIIALPAKNNSVDPHFTTLPSSFQVNVQVFDPLVRRNEKSVPQPHLAESWELVNDTTWIFRLRKDVKWHDGSPFTADDVVFTYMNRAGNVPNSPASFRVYLNQIKETVAVDDHTVRIVTNGPAPALLDNLAYLLILSKKIHTGVTTEDFHSGKAMIGTGPYKFVSWALGDTTNLARNDSYWGPKAQWDTVTFKSIEQDASRVAALLAKDVDYIGAVPPEEVDRLKSTPNVKVVGGPVPRMAYLTIDVANALKTGQITGPNGEKLDKNPLEDARVRKAMSLAIDRKAFTTRLYQDMATPTAQYLLPGFPGHVASLTPDNMTDVEQARKLLAEAGWDNNKFKIRLQTAVAYFPKNVQAAEGIAQAWTRIGIPTSVETAPVSSFFQKRQDRENAICLVVFNNSTGMPDGFFATVFHSRDAGRSFGVLNTAQYSNAEVDRNIEQAMVTMDKVKRDELYQNAAKAIAADNVLIPLWFLFNIEASRADIAVTPRLDSQLWPASAAK